MCTKNSSALACGQRLHWKYLLCYEIVNCVYALIAVYGEFGFLRLVLRPAAVSKTYVFVCFCLVIFVCYSIV